MCRIDLERPALERLAVQRLNCGLSIFLTVHRDEGKPSRTARFAVVNNLGLYDDTVRRKELHEIPLRHVEGEVADKECCFHKGCRVFVTLEAGGETGGSKPLLP